MSSLDLLKFVLLSFLWGSAFLFMRIAAPEFGAVPLIAVRAVIASAILVIPILAMNQMGVLRRHWKPIFISGLLTTAIPFTLIAYSSIYLSAGFVSILNATVPIWSVLVVFVWLGEKPSRIAFIGVIIGFIGVIALNWEKLIGDQTAGLAAVIAGLLATLFYALMGPFKQLHLSGVNPIVITGGGQIASVIALVPLMFFQMPEQMPSVQSWLSVVALSVLCTAVAFILFFQLLESIGTSKTMSVAYVIPISAILLGFLVLGETVTWQMLIGGSLILLGVAFTNDLISVRSKTS